MNGTNRWELMKQEFYFFSFFYFLYFLILRYLNIRQKLPQFFSQYHLHLLPYCFFDDGPPVLTIAEVSLSNVHTNLLSVSSGLYLLGSVFHKLPHIIAAICSWWSSVFFSFRPGQKFLCFEKSL